MQFLVLNSLGRCCLVSFIPSIFSAAPPRYIVVSQAEAVFIVSRRYRYMTRLLAVWPKIWGLLSSFRDRASLDRFLRKFHTFLIGLFCHNETASAALSFDPCMSIGLCTGQLLSSRGNGKGLSRRQHSSGFGFGR